MEDGSGGTILTIVIALAIGAVAGYWFRGQRDASKAPPPGPAPEQGAPVERTPSAATKPSPAAEVTPAPPAAEPEPKPAPKAEPKPEPKSEQKAAPAAAPPERFTEGPPATVDDLRRLRGVGPKMEEKLHDSGIYQYAQIARLDEAGLRWLGEQLTISPDRIARDDWVSQARELHREVHGSDPV